MAEDANEALRDLLSSLRDIGASDIAVEIEMVISRGAMQESEVKGQFKELSQRPLLPYEAYKIALEMLVASFEPLFMQKQLRNELTAVMRKKADIVWFQDYVEESPIKPEEKESIINMPYLEEGEDKLEEDLKHLLKMLEGE